MRMEETILLYLIIGLTVGAALAWRDPRRAAVWLTLGVLFWPIFLPLLFAKPRRPRRSISELDSLREEAERLTASLPEVGSLTNVLDMAAAIRSGSEDLARLLSEQEAALAADEPSFAKSEKAKQLRETRVADLARIRAAQDEQDTRYLRIVSRVREAITQAHLARFSDESRRELQKQMARLGDEASIIGGRDP